MAVLVIKRAFQKVMLGFWDCIRLNQSTWRYHSVINYLDVILCCSCLYCYSVVRCTVAIISL